MSLPHKYIAIDEEGYPLFGEIRVTDPNVGGEILSHLKFAENGAFSTIFQNEEILVEPFDEPYVAGQVLKYKSGWRLQLPYDLEISFDPKTLTLDEWDRFHGTTKEGLPFVFSRKAQAEFFRLVDDYDDDSVTIDGVSISLPPWLEPRPDVQTEKFWSHIYQTETPRWELNEPAEGLKDMLPRLKLPKSKILVLGCGSGNDAAYFAEHGHVVTAVDISPEAIHRGKEKYSRYSNITWIESDIFKLGPEHSQNYDIIFEHTCYCAIDPNRRNELVQLWKRFLAPGGSLLGIFFVMERKEKPPFGGTEWELRERLKKYFQFVFWGRWHQSIDRRDGKELLVYAQKKA
jgi:SAM-dependent methyltransferase